MLPCFLEVIHSVLLAARWHHIAITTGGFRHILLYSLKYQDNTERRQVSNEVLHILSRFFLFCGVCFPKMLLCSVSGKNSRFCIIVRIWLWTWIEGDLQKIYESTQAGEYSCKLVDFISTTPVGLWGAMTYRLEDWILNRENPASLITPRCHSSLSYINEYLAIQIVVDM